MRHIPLETAVILAAGRGLRLRPHTDHRPKCLVEVNGRSILSRQIASLEACGFRRLVVVTGFGSESVIRHVMETVTSLDVEFIHNERYATTNNVLSLSLARELVDQGFVLLESDLVFDPDALIAFRQPDRIALDRYRPEIHSGTTVDISESGTVTRMHVSKAAAPAVCGLFKTVNITSFSERSWKRMRTHLDHIIGSGMTGVYYETAIKTLIESDGFAFERVDFSGVWWDEIDTESDLLRVMRHEGVSRTRETLTV
jgi:choline kinase